MEKKLHTLLDSKICGLVGSRKNSHYHLHDLYKQWTNKTEIPHYTASYLGFQTSIKITSLVVVYPNIICGWIGTMVSEKSSKFYFTNYLKYIKEIISIKLQYKFQFILVLNVAVTKRHIKRISSTVSLKRMTNIIYTYLVLGRDKTYLVKKKPTWFYWNWYNHNAWVIYWQHICYVWWMCFSTDSRNSYRYQLCTSLRLLVPLRTRQTSFRSFFGKTSPIF